VSQRWRLDDSRILVERPSLERALDRSFADEIAIDFPSVGAAVARMRHAFLESDRDDERLRADILLSRRQAGAGTAVPLEVPVRSTCRACGGRGEVWSEVCGRCEGSGHALHQHRLTVSVPAGVVDGESFTFRVLSTSGPPTRVEVRVAVA
jgi:hypothetical protein